MKASSIQQESRLEPPRLTKGNVTPVKGRMSSVPKTFRPICTIIMVTAAQPAIT